MDKGEAFGYVVETEDQIPPHLRDRAPLTFANTEAVFRFDEKDLLDENGRVRMAGALEFQTQITPGFLTDLCDPEEIYKPEMRLTHRVRCVYDPEIQRGIKETERGAKEFLRPGQIESMMKDIMENRFECPQLMWNLRAGETSWVYVRKNRELRFYEGVATRPDTNHRHHAIIRVHRKYLDWVRQTGSTKWGDYNPSRGYGLVIYTDDFQGEAHRFYVYNFLGWRVPTSTAHFIESKTRAPQIHTKLARELMDNSGILSRNVEILTNHLSRNTAKMVTFGTLVDALKGAFPALTEDAYDATRDYLLRFLEELHKIRPDEISVLSVAQRQRVRETAVTDQAVLWHGYLRLAARLREAKPDSWPEALASLGQRSRYIHIEEGAIYEGDPFDRRNPAWRVKGVIASGKKGPRVVNNRQAREGAFEFLMELVGLTASDRVSALGAPVTA
ncbi:MAG: DNA sulfur modification protein DndB [bacterium]|nr:DNA sulfur modification protein DndB [bacterium]